MISYLKKSPLIVSLYQKMIGYKRGNKHWCRVVMDDETEKIVQDLDPVGLDVLEISGKKWETRKFKSYRNVQYPEFDICKDVLDQQFDLIIAEQVFEHIISPAKAVKNVYNMLKPGGHFLITTPFLLKIHVMPHDCSRWSPEGMKFFLNEGGFNLDDIDSRGWGNKECVKANLNEWMPYNPSRHSLENDPEFPVVVWALAQKQSEQN